MPNKLIFEKSPYLLQHAHNPVDWYPWSEEAFETAKNLDKPVFLSIGYSTCHWCHVMEKESFEDKEIAMLMNDAFINIKVDREERPDIDAIYMEVCQMLTGSGGWPLTIIMTPEQKPFFAGTYLPKYSRFGRIGMIELITKIQELWQTRREEILKSAESIYQHLKQSESTEFTETTVDELFEKAYKQLESSFDYKYGGFGHAPKFPTPHNLEFLLRYWKLKSLPNALDMVVKTLKAMRMGGIFDHLGFGFHRYSTDNKWIVPHFEKMLYDQALLIKIYTEVFLATKEELFKKTAIQIAEYIIQNLMSEAFESAEDADSEGVEGKFYLWTKDEITQLLKKDAEVFCRYFTVLDKGNFTPELGDGTVSNILYMQFTHSEQAKSIGISEEELENTIEKCRKILLNYRNKRVKPHKDDKILTDWNGLAIASISLAGAVFDRLDFITSAKKSADFILSKMRKYDGRLLHRYRDSEAGIDGMLDDYAFFINGLLALYEVTFEINYLKYAIELTEIMIEDFWDKENGGFYFTSNNAEKLITRKKELYDGAIPSSNSYALLNLIKLWKITSDTKYQELINKQFAAFKDKIAEYPSAYTKFITSMLYSNFHTYEIVIASENISDAKDIIKYLNTKFLPDRTILMKEKNSIFELLKISPYTREMGIIDGKATIYICKNFSCSLPVTSLEQLEKLLE